MCMGSPVWVIFSDPAQHQSTCHASSRTQFRLKVIALVREAVQVIRVPIYSSSAACCHGLPMQPLRPSLLKLALDVNHYKWSAPENEKEEGLGRMRQWGFRPRNGFVVTGLVMLAVRKLRLSWPIQILGGDVTNLQVVVFSTVLAWI